MRRLLFFCSRTIPRLKNRMRHAHINSESFHVPTYVLNLKRAHKTRYVSDVFRKWNIFHKLFELIHKTIWLYFQYKHLYIHTFYKQIFTYTYKLLDIFKQHYSHPTTSNIHFFRNFILQSSSNGNPIRSWYICYITL